MAFLHHKFTRKTLLALILIWSVASFWYLNPLTVARAIVVLLGILGFVFICYEIVPAFLLILLSFTTSYALYGFFLSLNVPIWQIMIAILIIFGYLFTYFEQKTGILGNKRLVYLILFSLIILEVFMVMSYFLINPLGQSLVISTVSYLFSGFCFAVLAKREDVRFSTYIIIAVLVIAAVFLTSVWSI